MRMLIITNRNIQNKSAKDEKLFGENVNDKGASELRLAWAEKADGKWKLKLINEPDNLDPDNLPSLTAFKEYLSQLKKSKKDVVFYVHGFNKSFLESLEQGNNLTKRYGVGVFSFSWPANPGGFITNEYKKAKSIASNSIIAMDRTFERLGDYYRSHVEEDCDISMNLLLHSLGNFMFEKFIRSPIFTTETRIFDNIVLNAPDVSSKGHRDWADRLKYAVRVYVTINERDNILRLSDVINSDRLGNTVEKLNSSRMQYLDLTEGSGVKKKHQHFEATANANKAVLSFFKAALHGEKSLPMNGFEYNSSKNSFDLVV